MYSFKDLRNMKGIDRNDVLDLIGLEQKPSWIRSALRTSALLGAGAAVGAAIALILAPKTGKDIRAGVKQRLGLTPDPLTVPLPQNGVVQRPSQST